jgi:hypothetical protein
MEKEQILADLLTSTKKLEETQEAVLEAVQKQSIPDFVATLALLNVVLGVIKLTGETDKKEGLRMTRILVQYFAQQAAFELGLKEEDLL